jgi:hypothetical protein
MWKTSLHRIIPIAAMIFVSPGASVSFADEYIYSGTPYNYSDIARPDLVTDTFTSNNHVSVDLTFSTALAANLSYNPFNIMPVLTPLNWTISDGNVTMNSGNAVLDYVQLQTNASGQITAWAIASDFITKGIATYNIGIYSGCQPMKTPCLPSSDVRDYSLEWANISGGQVFTELNGSLANSTDNNWETVGASVPEPSAWGIMLFGCAVLGLCVWWRNSRERVARSAASQAFGIDIHDNP